MVGRSAKRSAARRGASMAERIGEFRGEEEEEKEDEEDGGSITITTTTTTSRRKKKRRSVTIAS